MKRRQQSFKVERVNDEYGRVSSMLVGFREEIDHLGGKDASSEGSDNDEENPVLLSSRSSSQFWSRSRSPAPTPRRGTLCPPPMNPSSLSVSTSSFAISRVRSNNPAEARANIVSKRRHMRIPDAHSPVLHREQSKLLLHEKQLEQERLEGEKLPILSRIRGCLQRSAVVYNSAGGVVGTQKGVHEVSHELAQQASLPVGGGANEPASRVARSLTVKDSDDVDQLYECHMTARDLQKQLNSLMGNVAYNSYHIKRQEASGHRNRPQLGYASNEGQGHPSMLAPLRPHVHAAQHHSPSRSQPYAHEVSGSPISFSPDTLERRAGLTKRLLANQGSTSLPLSPSRLLAPIEAESLPPIRDVTSEEAVDRTSSSRGGSTAPSEELGLWKFQIEGMARDARRAAMQHVASQVGPAKRPPGGSILVQDKPKDSPPHSGATAARMTVQIDPTSFRSGIDIVKPGATDFSQAPVPRACRGWDVAYATASNGPLGKDQVCNLTTLRHKLERLEEEEVSRAMSLSIKKQQELGAHCGPAHASDEEDASMSVIQPPSAVAARSSSSITGSSKALKKGSHASIRQMASGRFSGSGRRRSGRDLKETGAGDDTMAAALRKRKLCGLWADWAETNFVSARAGIEEEAETEMAIEEETNMPAQDLHLYQLYCAHQKMTIIIRPISNSVLDLYAGTAILDAAFCDHHGNPIPQPNMTASEIRAATSFECRVKGKSINVSLKSSPFAPIGGLIPVNPALGKAYLDAVKRERDMEDLILNAQGGVMTITLLKRLKAQKAQAGSLTAGFVRDIQQSLLDSNRECAALLAEYQAAVTITIDKAAVSKRYIDRLNNAQYLGTTHALWHGMPVYYNEAGIDGVERIEEGGCPVFYIKRADGKFYPFSQEHQNVEKHPVILASVTAHFRPVEVVTHRSFVISPVTNRVEEDASSYLIGPDFDGLCYARNVHFVNSPLKDHPTPYTSADHVRFADAHSTTNLVVGMGLVYEDDVGHIAELRELTQWKHNHGYECANTVKSQPLTPGPYVLVTPTNARVIHTFEEIIGYYRWAWLDGTPLLLSPNWKVVIVGGLPVPYGEDLTLPIVDDCGYSSFMFDVDTNGLPLAEIKAAYTPMAQRQEDARLRATKAASNHLQAFHKAAKTTAQQTSLGVAQRDYTLVQDKKAVAQHFFALRRWQLMPPLFVADDEGYVLGANTILAQEDSGGGEDGYELSQSIERETTTSARDHFSMESNFEHHRAARVKVLEAEFNDVVAMFDELYPASTSFTAMLMSFVEPDMDFP